MQVCLKPVICEAYTIQSLYKHPLNDDLAVVKCTNGPSVLLDTQSLMDCVEGRPPLPGDFLIVSDEGPEFCDAATFDELYQVVPDTAGMMYGDQLEHTFDAAETLTH